MPPGNRRIVPKPESDPETSISDSDHQRKLKRVFSLQPASDIKVRQQQILALYAEGKTLPVISNLLSMRTVDVSRDLNIALQDMVRQYSLPSPEQNFVRYAAFQMNVIKKLKEANELFLADPEAKQYGASIASLRAQSDIYDKVFTKGVEFKVIQNKGTDQKALRATPDDLKLELRKEIVTLERLLTELDPSQPVIPKRTSITTTTTLTFTRKMKRTMPAPFSPETQWMYATRALGEDGNRKRLIDHTEEDFDQLHPDVKKDFLKRIQALEDRKADPPIVSSQQNRNSNSPLEIIQPPQKDLNKG